MLSVQPTWVLVLYSLLACAKTIHGFDCTKQFWPSVTPGDSFTVQGTCNYAQGYPRLFGETKVSVAYTNKWRRYARSEKLFNKVLPILQDSLSKSIEEYSRYAEVPKEIVVILTEEIKPEYLATWYPVTKQPPCQIVATKSWMSDMVASHPNQAKQAVAHELYHCVQSLKIGESVDDYKPSSLWVIEGSANYFSNVVYPRANIEWPDTLGQNRRYDPTVPIYAQDGLKVYGTSAFFQSLEVEKGKVALSNWVLATQQNDNGPAERRRLSGLRGFVDDFLVFGKHYTVGKIVDTSHVNIKGLTPLTPEQVSLSTDTVTLKTTPFTLKDFKLTLKPGHTYRMSGRTGSNQRIAWRFPSATAWKKMADPIVVPCKDSGAILILFISTKNTDDDSIDLTIRQSKKRQTGESCPIDDGGGTGFVLYPLRDEQLNAVCPAGTHTVTLAAWCCPDGSELDEAHAQTASICCPGNAGCYDEVLAGLKCADPSWTLWSKDFRQIGCCQEGFVPTNTRYCVNDTSQKGLGFSTLSQPYVPEAT